jgi:DNA end-binding protein Ku
MARAIWSGVLAFGLVSVPVEMYSATEAHEPTFHQFEKGTTDRIRYQRVNERTGEEVKYADIVRGADVGGGNYVLLDQDDLDSVAPGRSRSLDIQTFVDLEEIDPLYFNKAYYLGPRGDETRKVYALLRDAMGTSNKAAIATFVMRSKEYLAAVHADGDVLVLETLFFADEVRDPHEVIDNIPGRVQLSPQEVRMASQLIDTMAGPWKPSDYRDTYTDRVNDLIDAKVHQKEFQPAEQAPTATNVVDLMERLRASLDAAKKPPAGGAGKAGSGKTSSGKTSSSGTSMGKTSSRKSSSTGTSSGKTSSRKSSSRKTG